MPDHAHKHLMTLGVAALLTLGVLLLGSRSVLAGLGMLPAALIGWHFAAEGLRVARRML